MKYQLTYVLNCFENQLSSQFWIQIEEATSINTWLILIPEKDYLRSLYDTTAKSLTSS